MPGEHAKSTDIRQSEKSVTCKIFLLSSNLSAARRGGSFSPLSGALSGRRKGAVV
jgi:hypothetical protein